MDLPKDDHGWPKQAYDRLHGDQPDLGTATKEELTAGFSMMPRSWICCLLYALERRWSICAMPRRRVSTARCCGTVPARPAHPARFSQHFLLFSQYVNMLRHHTATAAVTGNVLRSAFRDERVQILQEPPTGFRGDPNWTQRRSNARPWWRPLAVSSCPASSSAGVERVVGGAQERSRHRSRR